MSLPYNLYILYYFVQTRIMETLPLNIFRAQLAATLDKVLAGERVQVTRHGVAIIELRPLLPIKAETVPRWQRPIKRQSLAKNAVTVGMLANPVLTERDEQAF